MCDFGIVTGALMVASTAAKAIGQVQAAQSQAAAGMASAAYNRQVADNEAATQAQLAQQAVKRGEVEADRQTLAARQRMGALRANMGASGFAMDSGSMLELAADSASAEQYDIGLIRQNAAQNAWQHQVAQTNYQNQSALADYEYNQAKNSTKGLGLQVAGTILGGLAGGLTKYSDLKATTTPTPKVGKITSGKAW